MEIEPEVMFLEHASASRYESQEAALESLRRVVAPASVRERRALERYAAEHLVEAAGAGGRRKWKLEPEIAVPGAAGQARGREARTPRSSARCGKTGASSRLLRRLLPRWRQV